MIRRIIKINESKCNGCGACTSACHEGAIQMVNGVAVLTREDYCDGLGDCLPACPTGAISFEVREAHAYDEAAVKASKLPCGCPGTAAKSIKRDDAYSRAPCVASRLSQWPCQIKLVPVNAPYFDNANLLIAADCTAFAYGNFHDEFIKNHITLIGCPKLDKENYANKLTQIIAENNIKSIKTVRMEVPCCGGLESAVKQAIALSGKPIPLKIITITTNGKIL